MRSRILRLFVSIVAFVFVLSSMSVVYAAEPLILGVTRWDAWTTSWAHNQMKYFKPEQWHYRLPFYAIIKDNGDIDMSEDKQTVIDREILYANKAGITYWNFAWYEPRLDKPGVGLYGFGNPLRQYLTSQYKNKINFTLSFMSGNMGSAATWRPTTVPMFLKYVKEPTYQKVLGGRPLVFFFHPQSSLIDVFGTEAKAATEVKYLRTKIKDATGKDPYIVGLISSPANVAILQRVGFDAASRYLTPPNIADGGSVLPYSTLLSSVSASQQSMLSTGLPYLTTATIGVDDRPRESDPNRNKTFDANDVADGTLSQKTQMIRNAVSFTQQHKTANPAQAILVYAWNELAEGGWMIPSLKTGDTHLRAVASGLGRSYPTVIGTSAKVQSANMVVELTAAIPDDLKIQLYDVGSVPWGGKSSINKVSASKHSVSLPNVNPPSQCNANKECYLSADLFDKNGNYYAMVTFVIPKIVPPKVGDITGPTGVYDGKVDTYDYNLLRAHFGETGAQGWISSDTTKDGRVDIYDYNQLVSNFGK